MKIQILGTGCAKCQNLAKTAEDAAKSLGLNYELEKITDIQKIMLFGVMRTPALAINGVVRMSGRVPTVDELKQILSL